MLLVNWFKTTERNKLPTDYFKQDLSEMLYYQRTKLPAVTHIDFSARLQTVTAESNPVLHDLLKRFKAKTGVGVLVNTSFNLRGEPIVCSPEDALKTFFSTEMDVLCMENFILLKVNQDKKIQVEQVKTIED
jgi:carbamoyltransferase